MMNGMEQARCVFQRRCFVSINPMNPHEMYVQSSASQARNRFINYDLKEMSFADDRLFPGKAIRIKFSPFEVLHFFKGIEIET